MLETSVVLIDGENLFQSYRRFTSSHPTTYKLDYLKLVHVLSEGTRLLRAYYYDAVPEHVPGHKNAFLNALRIGGVQRRTKVLRTRSYTCPHCHHELDKLTQKGVDTSLAVDLMRHAWQGTCQICIIVSGDEDFKDVIEAVKDKGVIVWVAAYSTSVAREMRLAADRFIPLDQLSDRIIFGRDTIKDK